MSEFPFRLLWIPVAGYLLGSIPYADEMPYLIEHLCERNAAPPIVIAY
jgi:hypothetical protein